MPKTALFDYDNACAISRQVERFSAQNHVIRLEGVEAVSLAALARLIVLRRIVVRWGGELSVSGLSENAKGLYEIYGLGHVLPRVDNANVESQTAGPTHSRCRTH